MGQDLDPISRGLSRRSRKLSLSNSETFAQNRNYKGLEVSHWPSALGSLPGPGRKGGGEGGRGKSRHIPLNVSIFPALLKCSGL